MRRPQVVRPSATELRAFLDSARNVSLFQSPEMLDVYGAAKRCKPTALGAVGADGSIIASLISVSFRDLPGISHASIRGGPVCSSDAELLTSGVDLLRAHESLVSSKTLYSRIYPLAPSKATSEVARLCGFARTPWINYHIPLNDLQGQWEKLSPARRKGIRRGEKVGLRLRDVRSFTDLGNCVHLLRLSARRNRFPLQHASLFSSILGCLVPKGFARMVLAELDGRAVATRIILLYRGTLYDWYAGSDSEFHRYHIDEWLVWELLKWGSGRGASDFDFGGAGTPNGVYGPREFKKRFGGVELELGRFTSLHYPHLARLLEFVRQIYQGVPAA